MQFFKHKQSGVIVEVNENDDADTVSFCNQGGGFLYKMERNRFFEEHTPVTLDAFFKGTVSAEFLEGEEADELECFTNGRSWNGFGIPYFHFESALKLTKIMSELHFNKDGDQFIWTPGEPGGEDEEIYPATVIEVDGQSVKVYPIGAGSWTWDSVKPIARQHRPRSAVRGASLVINAPEFFQDQAFMDWLTGDGRKFTLHPRCKGKADEFSDLIVLVEPSLNGEGSDSDMPEHIWDEIIETCRTNCTKAELAMDTHITVRITNLNA